MAEISQDELVHENDSPADIEVAEVHPIDLDENQANVLDQLVEMGVDEQRALQALRTCNFDAEAAQEWLILQQADDGRGSEEVIITTNEYEDIDPDTEDKSYEEIKRDRERRELRRHKTLLTDHPMEAYPASSFLWQLVQHKSEWSLVRGLMEDAKDSFTGLLKLEEQCKQWWPFSVPQITEYFTLLGEEMCAAASTKKRKASSRIGPNDVDAVSPAAAPLHVPSQCASANNKRKSRKDPAGGSAEDQEAARIDEEPGAVDLNSPSPIQGSVSAAQEEARGESSNEGEATRRRGGAASGQEGGGCNAGSSGVNKDTLLNHQSTCSNGSDPASACALRLVSPTWSPRQMEPDIRALLGDLARKKHTEIRNAVLNPADEVCAATSTQQRGLPHIFRTSVEEHVDLSIE
mmetsp:Transcript_41457/g.79228  ORF Transcript_41457/g.79228 Transcript_41457/m.79228 type:complete len:406 (-) Transcript_41457:309-1526(-)